MDTQTTQTNATPTLAPYVAFAGTKRIAAGSIFGVAARVKERTESDPDASVVVFDGVTSDRVELDLRGTIDDVVSRLEASLPVTPDIAPDQTAPAPGPGRPRLGVVAREVTLLPRHWEWLNDQPGGASVALRKLVEEARRTHREQDEIRHARESAYRFLSAMAGDLPGFVEATRALFAGNRVRFEERTRSWPADIREHALALAAASFVNAEHPTGNQLGQ